MPLCILRLVVVLFVVSGLSAETFTAVYTGHRVSRVKYGLCWNSETEQHVHCESGTTADNLRLRLDLDVECDRETIRVTAPSSIMSPQEPYEVTYNGRRQRVNSRVMYLLPEAALTRLVSVEPVDMWFGQEFSPSNGPSIGPSQTSEAKTDGFGSCLRDGGGGWGGKRSYGCGKYVTSVGNISWPRRGEDFYFEIPRTKLWELLERRKWRSEGFDSGERLHGESHRLRIHLIPLNNPNSNEHVQRLGGAPTRYGNYIGSMEQHPFYIVGSPTWYDIALPLESHEEEFRQSFPESLRNELNRLQVFYNACEASATRNRPVTLTPTARTAQAAVKSLAATPEWDDYKDLTLDEFEQVEDD